MHLKRILPSLSYSLSQDNNHATTEAAALYIGGLLLKHNGKESSRRYINLGKRTLEERALRLISDSGVFSQYSTNYQRMLIDTLSLVEIWRTQFKEIEFTQGFYKKVKTRFN